eukprot:Gb_05326 [translate_table: standard]
MQHVFTLYILWGYITNKILELEDTVSECSNDARIIHLRTQLESLKMSSGDSIVEHLQKLKEVINQLEGVGEIVENKEMVMETIIDLPQEGPTNLSPFITSLCIQGRVMTITFNDFEGLLL